MGRAITDDFFIKMRLLSFVTTEEHVTGHQLYRLINYVLATRLRLNFDFLASATRDSCSTNGVAMTTSSPSPPTPSASCAFHTRFTTWASTWSTCKDLSRASKARWGRALSVRRCLRWLPISCLSAAYQLPIARVVFVVASRALSTIHRAGMMKLRGGSV